MSVIIAATSSSLPEIFWVTTLVFWDIPFFLLKPKQPKWIATTERERNKDIAGIEGTERAITKGSGRY